MSDRRQHVILLGDNKGFCRALAEIMDTTETIISERPYGDLSEIDAAVWRFDYEPEFDDLRGLAAIVPTLVVAPADHLLNAVDAGIRGFVPDDAPLDQVRDAMSTILSGGSVVPPQLLGRLLRFVVERRRRADLVDELLDTLTDREREVYELAASGARKDDIADKLFISPDTARTHLQRVYRKLGVHSQAELITMQSRSGANWNTETSE